mgnify:CR=1 FL=1
MMTAGEYYVGDLCYVMSDEEWEEVCRLTTEGQKCISGEFTMADGRRFAMYNTAYGDGIYVDEKYMKYSVDSGTIGCIKVEDIKVDKYGERLDTLGNIYKFDFRNFLNISDLTTNSSTGFSFIKSETDSFFLTSEITKFIISDGKGNIIGFTCNSFATAISALISFGKQLPPNPKC